MKDKRIDTRRRRVVTLASLVAIAAVPARSALAIQPLASAKDLPRLDETEEVAKSLGYKHDAARVDRGKFPQYKPGQKCANCQLFDAKPGETWGTCTIFSGKMVNANGWCSAYNRKG